MNNWDTKDETILQSVTDIANIAREVRANIKDIPGAVFSVRINRQWAKRKDEPQNVLYVEGAIKFWGDEATTANENRSNLLLHGALRDITREYDLELIEGMAFNRYTLVQSL